MNGVVILWTAWVPWLLLLWSVLWLTRSRTWKSVLGWGILTAAVLVIPWSGHPLLFWTRALGANFSIPLAGLLAIGIFERVLGRRIFRTSDWLTAWSFGVLAALLLYPSALGLGGDNFDMYALGWAWLFWEKSAFLFGGATAASVILLALGNRFGLLMLLAMLGYAMGFQESKNLWDYLVDPIFAGGSILALLWIAVRKMLSKETKGEAPQPEDSF